ncbi:hypothetical protein AB0K16_60160 [Nonomuraea jabiensis]|uniref:hypothetical protein n=1 Tax=Nonomuraea jabiensis TaxID=882448 RepID=UPI00341B7F65
MALSRRLYDLIESHWPSLGNGSFAAVWSEGLDVEETARLLGADPDSATETSLMNIGAGFEGDQMPGDLDGILLIGAFGDWTLTLQLQWLDAVERRALSALSANARVLGVSWHAGGGGYRIHYAANGQIIERGPMHEFPSSLLEYSEGLVIPQDWDIPASQGSPREEMITTALALIARITGREIDQAWLEAPHTRFLIRRDDQ